MGLDGYGQRSYMHSTENNLHFAVLGQLGLTVWLCLRTILRLLLELNPWSMQCTTHQFYTVEVISSSCSLMSWKEDPRRRDMTHCFIHGGHVYCLLWRCNTLLNGADKHSNQAFYSVVMICALFLPISSSTIRYCTFLPLNFIIILNIIVVGR